MLGQNDGCFVGAPNQLVVENYFGGNKKKRFGGNKELVL